MTTSNRRDAGRSENPWLDSYTLNITTEGGPSVYAPGFRCWSLAMAEASHQVIRLELLNETGFEVTITKVAAS